MSIDINNGYEQFYKGTEPIRNYGSGENEKNKLVCYEFNTTDEHGNKVMDKMSREETLQAMKDIRSQYGDDTIVEFSGDGMAALVESRKNAYGIDNTHINWHDTLKEKVPDVCNELDDLMQQILDHALNHNSDGEKFGAKFIELIKKAEKGISAYDAPKQGVKNTAADELSYLSKKYSNYSFVAASYTKGMRYGSNSTVNVAIDPRFLAKMVNDPELEAEYEKQIAGMQKLDEENIRTHEARGRRIVAQGWTIDKNGGISRWGISEPTNKRHYGQEMTDYANKIREQRLEKKREQEKIEEKRQANREEKEKLQEELDKAGKEQFGDKWKGMIVIDKDDENVAVPKADKENGGVAGLNMDIKA